MDEKKKWGFMMSLSFRPLYKQNSAQNVYILIKLSSIVVSCSSSKKISREIESNCEEEKKKKRLGGE